MDFNEKSGQNSNENVSSSTNIFEQDDFSQSEDLVLIIEHSAAFFLEDIAPNRFEIFIDLMKKFIENRNKIDYRDRYFLIHFNNGVFTPKEDFENFSQTLITDLRKNFDKTESVGYLDVQNWADSFIKSLQKGIQKCISTFKAIRNKTLRIIFFLNQLPSVSASFNTKIEQVIERTAQKLDIIIDLVHIIGTKSISIFDSTDLYKNIARMTGGKYFQIKNSTEFREVIEVISKKKKVLLKQYISTREYTEEKQFLEIIASDMEKITDIIDDTELKCQICFQKGCSCDIIDDYQHIRRCPNCKKVLHLCCSGKWAEQQNSKSNFIGFPNVFRCPFCFYLLKVPREFVNFDLILSKLQEKWLKQKETEEREKKEEEKKEQVVQEFVEEFKQQQTERESVIQWLSEKIPSKTPREIQRIADDIEMLPNREEKISFINYLKYKEKIKDDSLPFKNQEKK